MTKVTSKLLTFLLSFAMVFTSIGWLGVSEVNADVGDNTTLTVKVVDQEGAAVAGAGLAFSDGTNNYYFTPEVTGDDGIASITLDVENDPDDGTFVIEIDEASKLEIVEGITVTVGHDESTNAPYFESVNGSENAYNGETVTMTVKAAETPAEVIDYVAVRSDAAEWGKWGINFADITADDFVLDVRSNSAWKAGHLPGATHVDVTVADSLTEDGKYIAEGSDVAKALDKAYADADGKRIVIVCVKGQTLAARTMQYFNATYFDDFGVDSSKVTYLIGGATDGIPEGTELVKTIDYVEVRSDAAEWGKWGINFADITADDFVLDVRPKSAFRAGHLPGSTSVDVTVADSLTEDGKYIAEGSDVAKALDKAYADADGKRIVIVCVKGQTLAARTMQYFNATYFDDFGVDSSKVTYLIGGATDGIPEGTDLEVGPELAPDTVVPRTEGAARSKTMTVNVDMSKYEAGKVVKVWIPVPQTEDYQTISNVGFDATNAKTAEITTDETYGNKMLYIEWDANAKPSDRKASLVFDATRVEAGHTELIEYDESEFVYPEDVAEYINKTSSMVKIDGIVKEYADTITEGKTGTLQKTRAIYEWIINNLERIDNGETLVNANGEEKTFKVEGCGYGNTKAILTDFDTFGRAGGHCTDLNSTFVALCRAAGIPAREMFGIRLGTNATDNASGFQHCWAEFYLPGTGWVFADPADVLKAIKTGKGMTLDDMAAARASDTCISKTAYFWGTVDNNRIVLSRGRDVTFNPPQAWGACNTFGYPAAEVDGKRTPQDFTVPGDFVYTISTKNPADLDDFVIEGTTITGLTDAGKAKLKENPAMMLPDTNADGEFITEIGSGTNMIGTLGFKDEDGKTYVPTSVTFPARLETIGDFAFSAYWEKNADNKNVQTGLTSVAFPGTLKSIGMSAFGNAPLTEVTLPEGLEILGQGAFAGNDANLVKITKISLPSTLKAIPNGAFSTSAIVGTLVIPEGIESIGNNAFTGAWITGVSLPSTLKTIGNNAFQTTNLKSVDIPASVESIGNNAFRFSGTGHGPDGEPVRASSLETITLHEGLVSIGKEAFGGNKISSVVLPSTVTTLHKDAFKGGAETVKVLTDNEDQLNARGDYTGVVTNGSGHVVTSLTDYAEAAEEAVSAAEEAVAAAQAAVDSLSETATAEEIKEAYEALTEAQQALVKAQATVNHLKDQEMTPLNDTISEQEGQINDLGDKVTELSDKVDELEKQVEGLNKQLAAATVVDISNYAATLDKDSYEYTGKEIKPGVKVSGLKSDDYTVSYKNNTKIGTATAVITANTAKNYKGSITVTFKITKKANTLTAKAKKVSLKAKKVKKKAQKISPKKAITVSKNVGKVTYKKLSGNKKIKVSKAGKITVKKGLKKGTYKVKIKVTAAGDATYLAGSKDVVVKIVIK